MWRKRTFPGTRDARAGQVARVSDSMTGFRTRRMSCDSLPGSRNMCASHAACVSGFPVGVLNSSGAWIPFAGLTTHAPARLPFSVFLSSEGVS